MKRFFVNNSLKLKLVNNKEKCPNCGYFDKLRIVQILSKCFATVVCINCNAEFETMKVDLLKKYVGFLNKKDDLPK